MKRIGNLYDQIVSIENLNLADEKARKGKLRTYGVQLHDKNREANILSLHKMLVEQTFQTSEYHFFTIFEPKERIIYQLPYFPDRIVHHAIMNVLEPIWVSTFTRDTYSCIKNRGIHKAAQDVRFALKNDPDGTKYCLKIDVRKFYPSIDHDVLKSVVRRKIKDARLLWLLDEIIDSPCRGMDVKKGVPIGNYLSQYFANLYLSYFDHWIKEEKGIAHYWRYADDIVILSDSKETLHALLTEIRAYFRDRLQLKVKRNYQVFPVDARGIDFLGYVFRHTHTLLRKQIKQSLCRRVAKLAKRKQQPTKEVYKQKIASWWGWCKYCDSIHFVSNIQKRFRMKLNLLEPNAHYDMAHGKPVVLEKDNDGSSLYRYNIEPEMGIPEGEKEEVQIGWQCREIRIWEQPNKAVVKKEIIRSVIDESAEFDIVNSYNKHILGVRVDPEAVDEYKEYLQFTEDLDALLLNDFGQQKGK